MWPVTSPSARTQCGCRTGPLGVDGADVMKMSPCRHMIGSFHGWKVVELKITRVESWTQCWLQGDRRGGGHEPLCIAKAFPYSQLEKSDRPVALTPAQEAELAAA